MMRAVWMEVWVMRLIMEMMLVAVFSERLLGLWGMVRGVGFGVVVVGGTFEGGRFYCR